MRRLIAFALLFASVAAAETAAALARAAREIGLDRDECYRVRDLVITREMPDHFGRSIVHRGQTGAELYQCLGLDPLNQVYQNVVEHSDLLLIEPISVVEK